MNQRKLSLAVRIIGITIILLAGIFTVLTYLVSEKIKEGVYQEQSANVLRSANQIRDAVDESISGLSRRILLVSKTEQMIEGLESYDLDELKSIARNSYQSETYFDYMAILDINGKVLVNYPHDEQQGETLKDEHFFESVVLDGELRYIDVEGYISPVSGNPVFALASPIYIEGELSGVYLAMVDLNSFAEKYILPHTYGTTGYAYLMDGQGTLLGHPTLPVVESNVGNYQFTKDILNSESIDGWVHYEWTDGWKYAFYSKMESHPWVISATIYDNDLLDLSNRLKVNIITISITASVLLGFILLISVMFFVTRPISKISKNLSSGSIQLKLASTQISSSSQELSSFSAELAASVEEISSSIEELQSVVELNTKNINQSELMMRDTNEGTQKVTQQMEELKGALLEINDNSKQIVKIIKVIEDIAFQTNILALNAAVEAARAGDAGRGFAVVADQVKDLAQKSASAASETALLIEKAIDSVSRGETLGEKVLTVQLKSGEMSQKVATLLDEVNRTSKEQMKGINQISAAISQTNQGVQQAAANSEETSATSEELKGQADDMNKMVDELNLLVKGKIIERKNETSRQSSVIIEGNNRQLESGKQTMISENRNTPTQDPKEMIPFDEDGFQEF